MSAPASGIAFDARSLDEPVDRAQLRAFTAATRTADEATGLRTSFVFSVCFIVAVQISIAIAFLAHGDPVPPVIVVLGPVLIAAIGLVQLLRWLPRRPDRRARFRIARLAAANGWGYADSVPRPDQPGMIFRTGTRRLSTAVVRLPAPRPIEIGNHRFVVDDDEPEGASTRTRLSRWGYASLRLDAPLPHIVLRSRGGARLPIPPAASQRLSLEGDLDRRFTLFCPQGYEPDALYLFTPDICARLIDHAGDFDVEIVDDRVHLYSARDLSTTDAATWTHVLVALSALNDKLDQWARWRDVRLGGSEAGARSGFAEVPAGVAPAGRRLRRAFPWVAAVCGILYLAFWAVVSLL